MESRNDFRGRENEAWDDLTGRAFLSIPSLIDVGDDGWDRYVESFCNLFVGVASKTNRVWYVRAHSIVCGIRKFADQIEFIRVLGEVRFERLQVTECHCENVRRLRKNCISNGPAAKSIERYSALL